ncbi:hypothetical protein VNO77_01163 [Canavalia gladiata]|uniref:Uncharacterized protein n=1 Tax=Canavalia gladiata TaxID=3824 RepID=A0AAN9MX96_CANGL
MQKTGKRKRRFFLGPYLNGRKSMKYRPIQLGGMHAQGVVKAIGQKTKRGKYRWRFEMVEGYAIAKRYQGDDK